MAIFSYAHYKRWNKNKSIKSYFKKVRFEGCLKRCKALNVSYLRRKTVSQFGSCQLKGLVTKSVGRHSALAGTNKGRFPFVRTDRPRRRWFFSKNSWRKLIALSNDWSGHSPAGRFWLLESALRFFISWLGSDSNNINWSMVDWVIFKASNVNFFVDSLITIYCKLHSLGTSKYQICQVAIVW